MAEFSAPKGMRDFYPEDYRAREALFGAWRLDEWNPVYIAPVFTALEYLSFEALGVGDGPKRDRPVVVAVGEVRHHADAVLGFGREHHVRL